MESFAPNVSSLITDFWQRYPARHDIRLAIGSRVVSVYANSELVLESLRTRYRDNLTAARPDILLAVIQDPELSPVAIFPNGRSSFSLTISDGRVEWIASKGLLCLFNGGRYMIGGACLEHTNEVATFIAAAASDEAMDFETDSCAIDNCIDSADSAPRYLMP